MRTRWSLGLICILMMLAITGCKQAALAGDAAVAAEEVQTEEADVQTEAVQAESQIILSTTTSTQDSGLLDYLLPAFTQETGVVVKVVAVGSGKAIQMGVDGEADVLLVHAKSSEEQFVKDGHGLARFDVMYNDFVILGPQDDPAGIKIDAKGDAVAAFRILSEAGYPFLSRGDDSGTDKKEKSIWKEAAIEPKGDWYLSTGKGMGDVIMMADEMNGYTMSDRATYLSMQDKIDLSIVLESDKALMNQYGVIAVNPEKNAQINAEGAQAFVDWILSDETQGMIGEFGVKEYGQALFTPNAVK